MSKVTLELIEKAKKEHGQVYVVEVDMNESTTLAEQVDEEQKIDTSGSLADGENIYRAILKKPDKRVLGMAMTSKDPIQMGNAILRNTVIDGDDAILGDDDVNVVAALQTLKFISLGQGKLKKF